MDCPVPAYHLVLFLVYDELLYSRVAHVDH